MAAPDKLPEDLNAVMAVSLKPPVADMHGAGLRRGERPADALYPPVHVSSANMFAAEIENGALPSGNADDSRLGLEKMAQVGWRILS